MTGFACAWEFRRDLRTPRDVLMRFVIPLLGGVLLLAVFVLACIQYADRRRTARRCSSASAASFVIGIGTLLLGVVLMVVYNADRAGLLPRRDAAGRAPADLLLEPTAGSPWRLPDTHERTVIAPDRSNLPPGREPYDPRS